MQTLTAALVLFTFAANAADPSAVRVHIDSQSNPWTHLNLNNRPENFQFAIVSDRTGGHREGIFEQALAKVNLLQPEFVMSVGDLIEGGTEDRAEIDREWIEFNSFLSTLEMPFFYVPGNHDISNDVMSEEWNKRYGRSYFHFVYRNVLFLCLNTEDPPRTRMSADQAAYVKKALDENPDVRWTLAFMHKPMWTYKEDTGWGAIEESLQGRPYTVFAGHTHEYMKYTRKDQRYIVLATSGGSTSLRGKPFGEFDEVAWVTMTDEGPVLANLLIEGIESEDVLTEAHAALIRPVLAGAAVRLDPPSADGGNADSERKRFRLTNDADIPMNVTLSINPTPALRPAPSRIEKMVAPNSVEFVDFTLASKSTSKAETDYSPPVRVAWEIAYAPASGKPITVSGNYRIVIDRPCVLKTASHKLYIDGDPQELADLPLACLEPAAIDGGEQWWKGPADASFRFGAARTKDVVYVALEVSDDVLRQNPERKANAQDGIEIWIDGRIESDRYVHTDDKEGENFLRVIMTPGAAPAGLPAGGEGACVATDAGYTAELALPTAYFDKLQGEKWSGFRMNVAVNDYDAEFTGPRTTLWWRHPWRSVQDIPGSGTFHR